MKSLYWISVIDAVDTVTTIFAIILLAIAIILGLMYALTTYVDEREQYKKPSYITGIVGFVCLVLATFCPSRNELYIIYGVGGTIDWINKHPDAQQLPEKTVQVLNKMADDYINKEEK